MEDTLADLPVFPLDIPGKVSDSLLSWALKIVLILFALANIPSSCIPEILIALCPLESFPRRNGLIGVLITEESARHLSEVNGSLNEVSEWILNVWLDREHKPDLRLWVRLTCTRTPGLRGHLGAGVGWLGICVECDDAVGLGGPPSGLIASAHKD